MKTFKTPEKKRLAQQRRMALKRQDPAFRAQQTEYNKVYRQKNLERLREQQSAYQKANLERIRVRRKNWKSRHYTQRVAKLVSEHDGLCDICKQPPNGRWKRLNIDHCHKVGHFRGLLCHNCNLGIGYFKDDPALLENAIAYLRKTIPGEAVFRG